MAISGQQSGASRQPSAETGSLGPYPSALLSFHPNSENRKSIAILLCISVVFLSSSFAQNVGQWRVLEADKTPFASTPISAFTFSADGSRLAVASADGITLFDTYTGEVLRLFPVLMDDLTALALSSDGRVVAGVGEDAIVRLWDAHTGEHISDLIGHADPVVTLQFSPDGNILASGSFKEIRLWDLAFGETLHAVVLQGHRDMVTALAFSPDSKTLASTSFYGTILLWDVETGGLRHSLSAPTDSILTLAFSPDNEILASGGYWSAEAESTLHIWNPHTGQLLATVEDHTAPVFAFAFSSDAHNETLVSAGWGNAIHIWDPHRGRLRAVVEGGPSPVVALAFLPEVYTSLRTPGQDRDPGTDGKLLASASLDGTIRLQSLRSVWALSDVNRDGVVNILDLTFIASRFGESSPDLNGDGVVNILDLVLVAQHIGK